MSGTGDTAGRCSPFADGVCAGNSLCVAFVCGFPVAKGFVVFVGNTDGADFGAFPAACAFVKINEAGFPAYPGSEFPWIAFKAEKFRIG